MPFTHTGKKEKYGFIPVYVTIVSFPYTKIWSKYVQVKQMALSIELFKKRWKLYYQSWNIWTHTFPRENVVSLYISYMKVSVSYVLR